MEAPFSLSTPKFYQPHLYSLPSKEITFICSDEMKHQVSLDLFNRWPHLEEVFSCTSPIKISISEKSFHTILTFLAYLKGNIQNNIIVNFFKKNINSIEELYEINQFACFYQINDLMDYVETYIQDSDFLSTIEEKKWDDLYTMVYSNREYESSRKLAKKIIIKHLFFKNQLYAAPQQSFPAEEEFAKKQEINALMERCMKIIDTENPLQNPPTELFSWIEDTLASNMPFRGKVLNLFFTIQSHLLKFFHIKSNINIPFQMKTSTTFTGVFYALFQMASQIQSFSEAEFYFSQLSTILERNTKFVPLSKFEKKILSKEIKFCYPFISQNGALFSLLFNEVVKKISKAEIASFAKLFFEVIYTCEKPKGFRPSVIINMTAQYVIKTLSLLLQSIHQLPKYFECLEILMTAQKELYSWVLQYGGNPELLSQSFISHTPVIQLTRMEAKYLELDQGVIQKILDYKKRYDPLFLSPIVIYLCTHVSFNLKLKNILLENFPWIKDRISEHFHHDLKDELQWDNEKHPNQTLSTWLNFNDSECFQTLNPFMLYAIDNLNEEAFLQIYRKIKHDTYLKKIFYENIIYLFKNKFPKDPSYAKYRIISRYGIAAIMFLSEDPRHFKPALEEIARLKLLEPMAYIENFFAQFKLQPDFQPSILAAKILLGKIDNLAKLVKSKIDINLLHQTLHLLQNVNGTFSNIPGEMCCYLVEFAHKNFSEWHSANVKKSLYPAFYFFLLSESLKFNDLPAAQMLLTGVLKNFAEAHIYYFEALWRQQLFYSHMDATQMFFEFIHKCPNRKKALKQWAIHLAKSKDIVFFKKISDVFLAYSQAETFLEYIYIFQYTFIKYLNFLSLKDFSKLASYMPTSTSETMTLAYKTFKKANLLEKTSPPIITID